MSRKKKLPKIEVRTLVNGYSLAIEGHKHEYMYFSPEKLMEGVEIGVDSGQAGFFDAPYYEENKKKENEDECMTVFVILPLGKRLLVQLT